MFKKELLKEIFGTEPQFEFRCAVDNAKWLLYSQKTGLKDF